MSSDNKQEIRERLASWRTTDGALEQLPSHRGETSLTETEVRQRQRRIGNMCLQTVKQHDTFYAQLKALVETGERDPAHQQRVEDEAAFALAAFEQSSARSLEQGIRQELDGLPKR
jgi:anti-sigma factor RsiW